MKDINRAISIEGSTTPLGAPAAQISPTDVEINTPVDLYLKKINITLRVKNGTLPVAFDMFQFILYDLQIMPPIDKNQFVLNGTTFYNNQLVFGTEQNFLDVVFPKPIYIPANSRTFYLELFVYPAVGATFAIGDRVDYWFNLFFD